MTSVIVSLNACPPVEDFRPCSCEDHHGGAVKANGSLKLNCNNKQLGNAKISLILNSFLRLRGQKLRKIYLNNNSLVNGVPDEIRLFDELSSVDLRWNPIRIIESGAFKFPDRVADPGLVDLSFNQITHIKDDAFQGNFINVK